MYKCTYMGIQVSKCRCHNNGGVHQNRSAHEKVFFFFKKKENGGHVPALNQCASHLKLACMNHRNLWHEFS
jgi:hypothetical protein